MGRGGEGSPLGRHSFPCLVLPVPRIDVVTNAVSILKCTQGKCSLLDDVGRLPPRTGAPLLLRHGGRSPGGRNMSIIYTETALLFGVCICAEEAMLVSP